MSVLNRYNNYIKALFPCSVYDFKDKETCINTHIRYMLNRTQQMFKWSNLPETIPQRILELYLQINGNVCFYPVKGELYVFTGGMGGEPDQYYMPTLYTIANPYFDLSKNLKINDECIVIPNDSMYMGLLPLMERYATGQTETELSLNISTINSRIINLISAPDDRTKQSAEKYLEDIEKGKLGIIAENGFLDGIRSQVYQTGNNTITDLIELEQYYKASFYNEIGLNANYNMKRESLNSAESQLNNDALLPLIDDMLEQRKQGAERVNDMFGTNISVEFSSAWEDNIKEIELEQKQMEGQTQTEQTQEEQNPGEQTQETRKEDPENEK